MTKKESLLSINEELNNTVTSLVESIIAVDENAYINGFKTGNIYDVNRDLLNNNYALGVVAFKSYTIAKITEINTYAEELIKKLESLLVEVKEAFKPAEVITEAPEVIEIVDGEEVIVVDGYKQLNYNYPAKTLEYTSKTCKLPIARYDYLLASKDAKIKKALQNIRYYEKYLRLNPVNSCISNIEILTERYRKSEALTNAYNQHIRDRENLFKKYIIIDSNIDYMQPVTHNIEFDDLPF